MSSPRTFFEYTNKKGRKYYYNNETGTTTFAFPADGIIFEPGTNKVLHTPPGFEAVADTPAQSKPPATAKPAAADDSPPSIDVPPPAAAKPPPSSPVSLSAQPSPGSPVAIALPQDAGQSRVAVSLPDSAPPSPAVVSIPPDAEPSPPTISFGRDVPPPADRTPPISEQKQTAAKPLPVQRLLLGPQELGAAPKDPVVSTSPSDDAPVPISPPKAEDSAGVAFPLRLPVYDDDTMQVMPPAAVIVPQDAVPIVAPAPVTVTLPVLQSGDGPIKIWLPVPGFRDGDERPSPSPPLLQGKAPPADHQDAAGEQQPFGAPVQIVLPPQDAMPSKGAAPIKHSLPVPGGGDRQPFKIPLPVARPDAPITISLPVSGDDDRPPFKVSLPAVQDDEPIKISLPVPEGPIAQPIKISLPVPQEEEGKGDSAPFKVSLPVGDEALPQCPTWADSRQIGLPDSEPAQPEDVPVKITLATPVAIHPAVVDLPIRAGQIGGADEYHDEEDAAPPIPGPIAGDYEDRPGQGRAPRYGRFNVDPGIRTVTSTEAVGLGGRPSDGSRDGDRSGQAGWSSLRGPAPLPPSAELRRLEGEGPSPSVGSIGTRRPVVMAPISVQMVLHLAFQLPVSFTRVELFQALKQWEISGYATAAFRKHRQGVIPRRKTVPLETLTAFATTPLKKPLLQSVPTELKSRGAQLFDLLLQATTVKSSSNPIAARFQIFRILQDFPALVDEFYFQLVKQTTNCPNPTFAFRAWDVFLLVASVFPASQEHYMWILAHIARATADADHRISAFAAFIFIRFQARYYVQRVLEWTPDRAFLDSVLDQKSRTAFGVSIYEMIWCQRGRYPRLPIPFTLYQLIRLLVERGASPDLFKASAVPRIDIAEEANQDIGALARADVAGLAGLLVYWLQELPNPVLPFELGNAFLQMWQEDKFVVFAESLPQAHRLVLFYIIGFLQDIGATADLADVFGPAIVNPQRVAREDEARSTRLTSLGILFAGKLIDAADTAVIYPLNAAYLAQKPGPGTKSLGQMTLTSPLDREPAPRRAPSDEPIVRSDSGSSGPAPPGPIIVPLEPVTTGPAQPERVTPGPVKPEPIMRAPAQASPVLASPMTIAPVIRVGARPGHTPGFAVDYGLDDQPASDEGWEGYDGPV
jgi:hypothetical protein